MDWRSIVEEIEDARPRLERAAALQARIWRGEGSQEQPLLLTVEADDDFDRVYPSYNTMETHMDGEKMFAAGLREALLALRGGAHAVPSMRANMGCGIVATMLGVRQQLFADKMPWVTDHMDKAALSRMEPDDLRMGEEMQAALAHIEQMGARLRDSGCRVFPLDIQGAFDAAHIVYGDAIFYDVYDDPPFVHHLLELCCHATIQAMDACLARIPGSDRAVAHYNGLIMPRDVGAIKLSEDTSTLLSADLIHTFVQPYLHRLLAHYGGGYVHYCGKNPHLFETVMAEPLAHGLNFGNPEKHDMDAVLRRCAQERKVYYGGVPRCGEESQVAWFRRALQASTAHSNRWLLLQHSCPRENVPVILDDWNEACAAQ